MVMTYGSYSKPSIGFKVKADRGIYLNRYQDEINIKAELKKNYGQIDDGNHSDTSPVKKLV